MRDEEDGGGMMWFEILRSLALCWGPAGAPIGLPEVTVLAVRPLGPEGRCQHRGDCSGRVPCPSHSAPCRPPASSSCFNGGTCVDGINSFTCLCPPGFTGSYCQHDVNECDSRPCLHGGTCQDSYGTYKCSCPQGYTGLNCQVSAQAAGCPAGGGSGGAGTTPWHLPARPARSAQRRRARPRGRGGGPWSHVSGGLDCSLVPALARAAAWRIRQWVGWPSSLGSRGLRTSSFERRLLKASVFFGKSIKVLKTDLR